MKKTQFKSKKEEGYFDYVKRLKIELPKLDKQTLLDDAIVWHTKRNLKTLRGNFVDRRTPNKELWPVVRQYIKTKCVNYVSNFYKDNGKEEVQDAVKHLINIFDRKIFIAYHCVVWDRKKYQTLESFQAERRLTPIGNHTPIKQVEGNKPKTPTKPTEQPTKQIILQPVISQWKKDYIKEKLTNK